jgi:hypothetical protein
VTGLDGLVYGQVPTDMSGYLAQTADRLDVAPRAVARPRGRARPRS